MDSSPSKTRHLALQRMAGTLLGAMVGPDQLPSAIGSGGSRGQHPDGHAAQLRCSPAGRGQMAGVVSGITLLAHAANPWPYAVDRLIETLLGITMAVLVSFVPKLLRVEIPDEPES